MTVTRQLGPLTRAVNSCSGNRASNHFTKWQYEPSQTHTHTHTLLFISQTLSDNFSALSGRLSLSYATFKFNKQPETSNKTTHRNKSHVNTKRCGIYTRKIKRVKEKNYILQPLLRSWPLFNSPILCGHHSLGDFQSKIFMAPRPIADIQPTTSKQ